MFHDYPPEIESRERRLWSAVLFTVLSDLCQAWSPTIISGKKTRMMRPCSIEAARWIGDRPSRDFREVCWRAGYDPEVIHEIVSPRRFWPEEKLALWRRDFVRVTERDVNRAARLRAGRAE